MNRLKLLLLLPLFAGLSGCDYIAKTFLQDKLANFEAQMQNQYQSRIQGLETDKSALQAQIVQLEQQLTEAKEKRRAAETREEERLRKFLIMYGVHPQNSMEN